MNAILKNTPVRRETNLGIPNKRRKTRFSHGVIAGFLAISLWGGQTFALPDNNGNDFILGFIPNLYTPTLELHLTSGVATEVTVQYPVNSPTFDEIVSVSPGVITTVVIPTSAQSWSSDSVANNAVHAFAAKEFTLYMVNKASATSDAALGLPVDVLDNDYIVMSYLAEPHGASEFLVIATEDNTTVTITPSVSSSSFSAEDTPVTETPVAPFETGGIPVAPIKESISSLDSTPFDITLNTGEGYFVYSKSGNFTGTLVHADKPISVINGNQCANVTASYSACDHIFQVAPPVSTWGTTALVADFPDRPNGTVYRILAAVDSTTVSQDGSVIATLNEGEFYDTGELSGNHEFEADQPILVTAFMTGIKAPGATTGDPAMGNVVPPEQFSNRYTFSTVGGGQFNVHYVQVLADNTETDTITLDGSPIGASNFTAIGSSGYSVANIPLTEGSHTTASDLGHGIFVMGLNSADSYLYAGGAQLGGLIEDNDAPVASDVNVSGAPVVDGTLTASYTYSDAEDDHEGDTSLQWLRADDAQGTNKAVISGATDNTYTPTSGDIDKFISVEVTPVAQTGTTVGKPVESSFVGPVSEEVIEYGELQFDAANYSVKENAGSATVVVIRENGSNGKVCVNYATANATATAPSDYTSSSDTVCWNDGETVAKPLKVKIIDDVDVEGNETFKMSLSNATGGATIGSPSAAVVTIVDIESECLHATYFTANRKLVIPLLDIPLLDPITEEPTGGIAVFQGDLNLINGVEDFKVIPDSMAFLEMLEGDNECHATYSYADRTIHIPFVDVPSVMVLPPGIIVPGPIQVFDATMQQLPLSDDVFHLKGYEYLYTIED